MYKAIIITPVKNSVSTTLETIKAIEKSSCEVRHIVYNDFSTAETKKTLEQAQQQHKFELVNLEDLTSHPSPNYKLVLQLAQKIALAENLPLIIVESDVQVAPNTIEEMLNFEAKNIGMVGAVTVDADKQINFPYLKFKNEKAAFLKTERSLSFCCTLLKPDFLKAYSFLELNESKDWFDVFISRKSLELGFANYVLLNVPVLHQPHGSRPWKQLKYSNPIKYYFLKLINRRDKI